MHARQSLKVVFFLWTLEPSAKVLVRTGRASERNSTALKTQHDERRDLRKNKIKSGDPSFLSAMLSPTRAVAFVVC